MELPKEIENLILSFCAAPKYYLHRELLRHFEYDAYLSYEMWFDDNRDVTINWDGKPDRFNFKLTRALAYIDEEDVDEFLDKWLEKPY